MQNDDYLLFLVTKEIVPIWKMERIKNSIFKMLKMFAGMRMEPLATNRQCLIWLCVCPADESASRWQRVAHTAFAFATLAGVIFGFLSSSAFVWKFMSIDLGRTMYAFTFMSGEVAVIYMALAGMILMRHKIKTVFDNLATIYEDSKY